MKPKASPPPFLGKTNESTRNLVRNEPYKTYKTSFLWCGKLLRKIENFAFRFCDRLETVYLPAGIEEMGYYIFSDSYDGMKIYLPITEDQIPVGWDENWNTYGGTVIWGYKGN